MDELEDCAAVGWRQQVQQELIVSWGRLNMQYFVRVLHSGGD